MLQGNYACYVETSEVQVHLLDGHTVCFHSNITVIFRRLLGFRRSASQPFQRLLPPPEERFPRCCGYPHAHPPGLRPVLQVYSRVIEAI